MKTLMIYKSVRKPTMDRGVVVTRVERAKRGVGSYRRKNKYGNRYTENLE